VITIAILLLCQLPTPEAAKALPKLADHRWGQITRSLADNPQTYGGHGQYDLLMAFLDPANAREWKLKVATKYSPLVMTPPNGDMNFTREHGWELPWAYSIYRDVLTPDEVFAYESGLKAWTEHVMGFGVWGAQTRINDSDVVHGHIPLIHGTDLALGTNYRGLNAGDLFPGTAKFVAVSYGQMRKAQEHNLRPELKGVLEESSGYNKGTAQLILMGSAACGISNYPEVQAWLPWLAETLQWDMTPDLKEYAQWGDVEGPHSLHQHALLPLMYQVIALGGDRDGKLLNLAASLELPDNLFWANGYRAMLCFDPRTLPAQPRYEAPNGLRVTRDHVTYRTPETLWHVFAAAPTGMDHGMSQPECKLWHKGRWILDSPRAYQPWPTNQNAGLVHGLEPVAERGLRSAELIDGGAKVVLETKGPRFPGTWDEPPSYIDSWTQTLTLQPGSLTRRDNFQGSRPTRLDRYPAWEKAAVESSPALQQLWHTPPGSTPKPIDGGFSWLCGDVPLTLTGTRKGRIEQTAIGTNIGSYVEESEEGGWLIRFDHDELPAEIESVLRWDQPTPQPIDVPVKGVIRGKQLIIELP
jgi:hypothetical protein